MADHAPTRQADNKKGQDMSELDQIKQALDKGEKYYEDVPVLNPALLREFPSGKIPWRVLWRDGDYYHFRHYGQAAVEATKRDLTWVMRMIFRMTPTRFLATYKTI